MRIVVRVAAIRRSVAWISSSIRASTDEVASSSSRMLGIGEQRAGERDALPLPTGEREALLADDGVVAVREPQDELVRLGRARGGLDLRAASRRAGRTRCWRVIVSEKRNESSNTTPMLRRSDCERDVAHVDAVDRDAARVHVVEARQQQADRRLARARAADERDRLARRDRESEVAQHRFGRRVAERHVVEAHLAVRSPRDRPRRACPARAGSSRAGRRCARRRRGRAGRP